MKNNFFKYLEKKSVFIKRETLKIHKLSPEIRIASCLSDIELFVVLFYGGVLNFDPKNPYLETRDRLIVSKGHGAVSLYPLLADLGFFKKEMLNKVCQDGSNFGSIPDCSIPGFETVSGSLGHGLGIGCGIAVALKKKKINSKVFVILGDGELNEGSVWEAIMFASFHKLGNLIAIVDNNKKSMLGYQKDILGLEPLEEKFQAFKWKTERVCGHDIRQLYKVLHRLKNDTTERPKVLIADTIKGKGVPKLERDPLCHVRYLTPSEIDEILSTLKC